MQHPVADERHVRILQEVLRLRRELGFAVVFITHDLPMLLEISDRIAVMKQGRIVELDTSLSELLWSFVGGEPKVNRWRKLGEIPAETVESKAMSKELKRRGFRFVGPTVCYAFMQSAGLVNDHTVDCFRYREVATLA